LNCASVCKRLKRITVAARTILAMTVPVLRAKLSELDLNMSDRKGACRIGCFIIMN